MPKQSKKSVWEGEQVIYHHCAGIALDLRVRIGNTKDADFFRVLAQFYGTPQDALALLAINRFLTEVRAALPRLEAGGQ